MFFGDSLQLEVVRSFNAQKQFLSGVISSFSSLSFLLALLAPNQIIPVKRWRIIMIVIVPLPPRFTPEPGRGTLM